MKLFFSTLITTILIGAVAGTMYNFILLHAQRIQIAQLSQEVKQSKNNTEARTENPAPATPPSNSVQIPKYRVEGVALLQYANNGIDETLVSDIRAAGVSLAQCHNPEDLVFGAELASDTVIFVEGCGEAGGTLWRYNPGIKKFTKMKTRSNQRGGESLSPDKRWSLTLGKQDADGEVRTLHLIDRLHDTEGDTAPLQPMKFTYVKGLSEFDGSSYGGIRWDGNYANAEVYLIDTPKLELFDERKPVFLKNVDYTSSILK